MVSLYSFINEDAVYIPKWIYKYETTQYQCFSNGIHLYKVLSNWQ